ncbi:hypothetical protein CE91St41_26680 [Oscillospiraceae bacterium]|nr:hypothetical protein CE91St40_10860 [Oscillospiraceae bacterium]BDF75779.1 hypothetical protein CE91St41_26680 [Oscillospiraceae bacterium]
MTINLVSDEKIAETSSKGNQEKWFDSATGSWYKLDQFGYEALAETLISILLGKSNIEIDTPFTFVRYRMERLRAHGRERTGCVSQNFLEPGQSLITVNRLLSNFLGLPLRQKLAQLPSDKRRIAYLAEATAEYTGLADFPRYLTLLFEIDALFCNDDRHLNNIAVIEQDGKYSYCPIFDNGAGLLSNTQFSQMDIAPKALLAALRARPFNTTFNRQMNTARGLYGKQLVIPLFSTIEVQDAAQPMLAYYPERDRGIITDRVTTCILTRQKSLW